MSTWLNIDEWNIKHMRHITCNQRGISRAMEHVWKIQFKVEFRKQNFGRKFNFLEKKSKRYQTNLLFL